jgi:triosephosphate isomerase (TIM)
MAPAEANFPQAGSVRGRCLGLILKGRTAIVTGSFLKEFPMRIPLVAGNWKMNGSLAGVQELLAGIKSGAGDIGRAEVAVCPPFVFVPMAQTALQGTSIRWGAQNLSTETSGAFTGEVGASMLKDFGCHYVIVGHSERRSLYGEDDEIVAKKFAVARAAGLAPILCVGETLEEREKGVTEAVVARQLDAVMQLEGAAALAAGVIAYEPVWAIGTGVTATPEQAQDVHAFIRSRVALEDATVAQDLRILYGGSMKPDNAGELVAKPDIDGGLIGGASLKAPDFLAICKAADVTLS